VGEPTTEASLGSVVCHLPTPNAEEHSINRRLDVSSKISAMQNLPCGVALKSRQSRRY
jgi:hypothetical protein